MKKTKFFTLVKEDLELKGVADTPLILDEGLSELMKREDGEIIPIGNELGAVKDFESTYLKVTKSGIEVITPKFVIRYNLVSRGLEYEFNPENREEPFSSKFKVSWSSSVYIRERNQEFPTRTYLARLSYNERKGLQLYVGIDKEPDDKEEEEVLISNSFITVIVDELIRELKSMNLISELQDWVKEG